MRTRVLFAALCILAAVPQARAEDQILTIAGDTVTIVRDRYGVPHVFAGAIRGLFYGNGYAVAQDRIGQMDLYRRSAKGEMAALVGSSAVAADRETRIDGYTEAERMAQFERLPGELKAMMSAYAEGINAYIAEIKAAGAVIPAAGYPARQGKAGLDPADLAPWSVTDSVAIGQMMARRFGGDEGGELRNMLVLSFLKARFKDKAYALFNDALWRNDPNSPTTIPPGSDGKQWPGKPHWTDPTGKLIAGGFDAAAARLAAEHLDQSARMELAERCGLMTKWGSYCMAVSAAKSATGDAMLVGGPQMGFRTPQIAHEVHLSGAGIETIGMGFAGVPGVLIGHNADVAWSTTTGVNDQTDIFVETLNPADPAQYRFNGAWRTMEKRVETIAVAGGDSVTVEVFRTVHGPVVQWDKAHNLAYSRKASYWDRELETFVAVAGFARARTAAEFGAACAAVPTSHNWFCATRTGDIGFWFCGFTPIRATGVDPRLPTPGDGSKEWQGILPFERMPHAINPKQGFLSNWNNKPAVWWDNMDTPVWGEVFHNGRIAEMLAAKPKLAPEDLRTILLDIGTNDYNAQVLLPFIRDAVRASGAALAPEVRRAVDHLLAWDHHATEGSVAKTIFDAWLQQVREDLFAKSFGFIKLQGGDLFNLAMQPSLIVHVLRGAKSRVPVQFDHLAGRKPNAIILEALSKAVASLSAKRGPEPALWRSTRGQIGFSPLPSIPSTDRGTYIQIVECARPRLRGMSILPPGQSERTDSPHFGDQREMAGWFFFKPMLTTKEEISRQ